ncbi:MAG TPA: sodium-translocating pyrophosphatase [Candidatus Peribacterales bacterium]|nr:sodium-translocating pyrophosphatase [Candidatus Peribacterales bacterium]
MQDFLSLLGSGVQLQGALLLTVIGGIASLIIGGVCTRIVLSSNAGSEKMQGISAKIREGALAFLGTEYRVITPFVIIITVLLYIFIDRPLFTIPATSASFLLGAFCSALAGFLGMYTATRANVRTAHAASSGIAAALRISYIGGATMGFSVVGLALLGFCIGYIVLTRFGLDSVLTLEALTGFTFGGSVVALFARVGGGIYTKAADVGADLVGKIESGIPEDDPRNPAVIADNVGDNVGDVAGMGADLFESYIGAILASMLMGLTVSWNAEFNAALIFPLFVSLAGLIGSFVALFCVHATTKEGVQKALKTAVLVASLVMLACTYVFGRFLIPAENILPVFLSVTAGLVAGMIIGSLTEYCTSHRFRPVQQLVNAAKTGPATVIIEGLSLGYLSTLFPIITIVMAMGFAFEQAGMYGVAIGSVGMLSTLATILAIDVFGPISDNAGGIAEMAGMPDNVRDNTDALDSAGNTTAAIGKGFAIGMAGFMCLALLSAFKQKAGLQSIDATSVSSITGILIGGTVPFLFSALTMRAVGRAAMTIIEEVRRQFREIPGLMEGKAEADSKRCVAIATHAAIFEMIGPGILAVGSPIIVGFLLGREAVGGLLVGCLVVSMLLGLSMSNSGGAWDNAKKYIEAGHLGGKKSDAHKAAVVGDTVGDPFKDTSGPSLNILIKLMMMVSLLTVTLYQ